MKQMTRADAFKQLFPNGDFEGYCCPNIFNKNHMNCSNEMSCIHCSIEFWNKEFNPAYEDLLSLLKGD